MHCEPISQLDETVTEVFAAMLNLPCTPRPVALPLVSLPDPGYTASVKFSGSLDGFCTIYLSRESAAGFTAIMADMPPEEIPDELSADTAGELCNMIAGSWKTRQSPERALGRLSCPVVTLGAPILGSEKFAEEFATIYQIAGYALTLHLAFS